MEESTKTAVMNILNQYLETNHRRKTSERNTILNAVYSISNSFSIDELNNYLEKECKFFVSQATLYNTLHLLVEIHLVVRINTNEGTRYEACYSTKGHCRKICTICGTVKEFKSKEIEKAVTGTHFKRFHKDGYSLYIYGICTYCQAKMTKKRIAETKKGNKKTI